MSQEKLSQNLLGNCTSIESPYNIKLEDDEYTSDMSLETLYVSPDFPTQEWLDQLTSNDDAPGMNDWQILLPVRILKFILW